MASHRRRRPIGPPLCSTTFGGSTVPPLFGGGGGGGEFPTSGDIFVRDAGALFDSSVDGTLEQDLSQPGNLNFDDDLYVLMSGFAGASAPVNAGDWIQDFTEIFNRFRQFRRKATLTAADRFIIPSHAGALQVGRMVAFSNTDDVTKTVINFQGGFKNTDIDDTWNVDPITVNTSEDPLAAIMLFCHRDTSFVVAGAQVNNISPLPTVLIDHGVSQGGIGSVWTHWSFDYVNPSIGYSAFVQGYSPTQGALQVTQFKRYKAEI